jgi:hypothetical protein
MPNVVPNPPTPQPEPLFTLDLGPNGGVLAPRDIAALRTWISTEISFWSWFGSTQSGAHREAIDRGYRFLANAIGQLNEAQQFEHSNESAFNERITNVKNSLSNAFVINKLPHSSSRLAKRVEDLRKVDPLRAIAYVYTQLNPNGTQFDARDLSSWSGFLEGLAERTKITDIPKSTLRSATESVDELRREVEHLLAERQQELDQLHRTYQGLTDAMATKEMNRSETWEAFIAEAKNRHDTVVKNHEERMAGIEAVFREKMTLRGPVEYWSKRQAHHKRFSVIFGALSFFLIAFGGGTLAIWAGQMFSTVPVNGSPKAWQVTTLIVVAVFLTWAIRLIIRLFLSHSHLGTDAAERVVMTQTYLALLEENRLTEEKDRSLVLGALFRPASDGMVKEENIPHPMLDALTRLSGKG